MHRLELLYQKVITMIEELPDAGLRQKAYVHSCGVAQIAALLAARRGLNTELAAVAGILHDIWAYQAGTYEDHCHKGAVWAAELLSGLDLYTADEIETVRSAIHFHDDRQEVHAPYDEALKDADILAPYLHRPGLPAPGPTRDRLIKLLGELNIPCQDIPVE
jgi:putative nucleotidyltransferase with HDIG domain